MVCSAYGDADKAHWRRVGVLLCQLRAFLDPLLRIGNLGGDVIHGETCGKTARRLLEHAHAFEPIQDGRIYIEKLNGPFLFGDKGIPAEYSAGLKLAIDRGWLEIHDSGTFVKFTAAGADLFA